MKKHALKTKLWTKNNFFYYYWFLSPHPPTLIHPSFIKFLKTEPESPASLLLVFFFFFPLLLLLLLPTFPWCLSSSSTLCFVSLLFSRLQKKKPQSLHLPTQFSSSCNRPLFFTPSLWSKFLFLAIILGKLLLSLFFFVFFFLSFKLSFFLSLIYLLWAVYLFCMHWNWLFARDLGGCVDSCLVETGN